MVTETATVGFGLWLTLPFYADAGPRVRKTPERVDALSTRLVAVENNTSHVMFEVERFGEITDYHAIHLAFQ